MDIIELRRLCAIYWNPFRIPMANISSSRKGRPLPEDEYDAYLLKIIEMLDLGQSPDQIYEYVDLVEREYLSISSSDSKKKKFIQEIFKNK